MVSIVQGRLVPRVVGVVPSMVGIVPSMVGVVYSMVLVIVATFEGLPRGNSSTRLGETVALHTRNPEGLLIPTEDGGICIICGVDAQTRDSEEEALPVWQVSLPTEMAWPFIGSVCTAQVPPVVTTLIPTPIVLTAIQAQQPRVGSGRVHLPHN